jgi:hypothetical protein
MSSRALIWLDEFLMFSVHKCMLCEVWDVFGVELMMLLFFLDGLSSNMKLLKKEVYCSKNILHIILKKWTGMTTSLN